MIINIHFSLYSMSWMRWVQKSDHGSWCKHHRNPAGNRSRSDQVAQLCALQRPVFESECKLLFSASRSNGPERTTGRKHSHEACCGCIHMGMNLNMLLAFSWCVWTRTGILRGEKLQRASAASWFRPRAPLVLGAVTHLVSKMPESHLGLFCVKRSEFRLLPTL